ncbi:MAG: hypothetical protein ACC742_00605 [Thermoanaerobaculales bacterium]
MRKTLAIIGVLVLALTVSGQVLACDGKAEKTADNEAMSCARGAAKAAYAKNLEATGSIESAQEAYRNALAEGEYAKAYAESSCSKTATKAAYDAVLAETSCSKSANTAATHAVAKASYDETLTKTGCAKSAQEAYDGVVKTAGASCSIKTESAKSAGASCSMGAETDSGQIAQAETGVEVASNEETSSR